MLNNFAVYYAGRKECFMLLIRGFACQSKGLFFNKFLVFLPMLYVLTGCHSKEENTPDNAKNFDKPAIVASQTIPTDIQVLNVPTASVTHLATSDNVQENTLKNDTAMLHTDENMDKKSVHTSQKNLNTGLTNIPKNSPNPLSSMDKQDIQQAYLASIYTLKHNIPDIKKDENPDVAFVKNMIHHRQGVIRLANLQLEYGTDASLQHLAKDTIIARENEIWLMTHWLKEVHPTQTKKTLEDEQNNKAMYDDIAQEYQDSLNQMHEQMLIGALQTDADMIFVHTMLPYFKGALALAQVELNYGTDTKVRNLANNIMMSQISEIQALQKWQKEHRSVKKSNARD